MKELFHNLQKRIYTEVRKKKIKVARTSITKKVKGLSNKKRINSLKQ
jgi:hypothetical protein